MKTINRLFILIAIVLLSFSINTYGQAQTHTVTLYVNTSAINNQNISTTCNFGQEEGVSNEEYSIEVNVGDTIIWEGVSTSSDTDVIAIRKIKYERGTNVFDGDEIEGTSTVVGTVLRPTGEQDYKYKISFKVNDTGATYYIDPKVKVKP